MNNLLFICIIIACVLLLPYICKKITDEPMFALIIIAMGATIIKIAEWTGVI